MTEAADATKAAEVTVAADATEAAEVTVAAEVTLEPTKFKPPSCDAKTGNLNCDS